MTQDSSNASGPWRLITMSRRSVTIDRRDGFCQARRHAGQVKQAFDRWNKIPGGLT